MLAALGLDDVDQLFQPIPSDLRAPADLDLPRPHAEQEVAAELGRLAARNRHMDELTCFLGAGRLRPLRAGLGLVPGRPGGVRHLLHPLPAGDEPGRAPGPVRVPDADQRADRPGDLQRLAVRRRLGGGRGRDHGRGRHPAQRAAGERGRGPAGAGAAGDLQPGPGHQAGRGRRPRRPDRPGRGARQGQRPDGGGAARPAQLLRGGRGRGRGGRPGPRGRGPDAGHLRPADRRGAGAAGAARGRRRGRRGPGAREPPQLRRPGVRVPGLPVRGRAAAARAAGRRDPRHGRAAGLRAHPPGPRAAHPAGEGDQQHLHQPDPERDRGRRVPDLAGAAGPGGAGAAVPAGGPVRGRPADRHPRGPAGLRRPAVRQGARGPAAGRPGRGQPAPGRPRPARRAAPGRPGPRPRGRPPGRGDRAPDQGGHRPPGRRHGHRPGRPRRRRRRRGREGEEVAR